MWRSFFMALGIYVCILGTECLIIDKAVLADKEEAPASGGGIFSAKPVTKKKEYVPPDWAPWSLLSAGAIAVLYSITLTTRGPEKK